MKNETLKERVKKIQESELNLTEQTARELQETIEKGEKMSKETDKLLRDMLGV